MQLQPHPHNSIYHVIADRPDHVTVRIDVEGIELSGHERQRIAEQIVKNSNTAGALLEAIERSDLDVSPCTGCGRLVVCVPDGLCMCGACALESAVDYKGGDRGRG